MNKNRISLLTSLVAIALAMQSPFVAYANLTDNLPTCAAGQVDGCKPDNSVNEAEDAKLARQNAGGATPPAGTPQQSDPGKSTLMGTSFKFNPNDIAPTTKKYDSNTNYNVQMFLETVSKILLILVSTGAVLSIVIGGFYMATSGGDTEKANKGKIIITYNIIAICIAMLSYGIIQFVIWVV